MEKITIAIHGMSCGHCEMRVKKELEAIPGIESVDASAADKNAIIVFSQEVPESRIKEAVAEAGYEFKGFVQ